MGQRGYEVWELAEKLSLKSKEENVTSVLILELIIQGGYLTDGINSNIQIHYSEINATDSIVTFSICPSSSDAIQEREYCFGLEDLLIKNLTNHTLTKIIDSVHIETTISEAAQEAYSNYLEKNVGRRSADLQL